MIFHITETYIGSTSISVQQKQQEPGLLRALDKNTINYKKTLKLFSDNLPADHHTIQQPDADDIVASSHVVE